MTTFLTLVGISAKGRQRIAEHGDVWQVIAHPPGVLATSGMQDKTCIKSVKTGAWRWLNLKDFRIV